MLDEVRYAIMRNAKSALLARTPGKRRFPGGDGAVEVIERAAEDATGSASDDGGQRERSVMGL
jgi:hypothetical protein